MPQRINNETHFPCDAVLVILTWIKSCLVSKNCKHMEVNVKNWALPRGTEPAVSSCCWTKTIVTSMTENRHGQFGVYEMIQTFDSVSSDVSLWRISHALSKRRGGGLLLAATRGGSLPGCIWKTNRGSIKLTVFEERSLRSKLCIKEKKDNRLRMHWYVAGDHSFCCIKYLI